MNAARRRFQKSTVCFRGALFGLLLAGCLLWAAPHAAGQNHLELFEHNGVPVWRPPSLAGAAQEIASIVPELQADLSRHLEWSFRQTPAIVLIASHEAFRRITGRPHIVAFAAPAKQAVVLDYSVLGQYPDRLGSTLKHELCHILLHQHIPEGQLPLWLDEGVAQWLSDSLGEVLLTEKHSLLNRAALTDQWIPLSALARSFPREKEALLLAYEQSKSFVSFLSDRFGAKGIRSFLRRMAEGETPYAAARSVFDMSLPDLERAWQRETARRTSWLAYAGYYLYDILFAAAGLLAAYGAFRAIRRKRALFKEMEEES